jgi:hypothetical protein
MQGFPLGENRHDGFALLLPPSLYSLCGVSRIGRKIYGSTRTKLRRAMNGIHRGATDDNGAKENTEQRSIHFAVGSITFQLVLDLGTTVLILSKMQCRISVV